MKYHSRIVDFPALFLCLICPSLQYTRFSDEPNSCEIIGDIDVYGIGVRISFYLNWAAAFIALLFDLYDEHKGVRRAIIAIALAVITNTIINTTKGSFAMLEWYIVFNMILILPFLVSIPFSWTAIKEDALGMCLLALLNCIYSILQPWLYFTIPRQGYKSGCRAYFFLYHSIDLYNSVWIGFSKAFAIFGVIGGGFGLIVLSGVIPYVIYTNLRKNPAGEEDESKKSKANSSTDPRSQVPIEDSRGQDHQARQERTATPGGSRERSESPVGPGAEAAAKARTERIKKFFKRIFLCYKILIGLSGASVIVFIEETIRINRIDLGEAPLSATSQLIPFTVGLFSLIAVLWTGIKKWRNPRKKERGKDDDTMSRLLNPATRKWVKIMDHPHEDVELPERHASRSAESSSALLYRPPHLPTQQP